MNAFEQLIPSLETISSKQIKISGIRFIETVAELKNFYNRVIDEYANKQYYIIGSAPSWEGLDPKFFKQHEEW